MPLPEPEKLAILGGRSLLKVIPLVWVTRGTALVMLAFACGSIATALA